MRIGGWKFGDQVVDRVSGLAMTFIEWLADGITAVCRVITTGEIKKVAGALLIAAGMFYGAAHGHPPEDPPGHGAVKLTVPAVTPAASGAEAQPFGLDDEAGPPQAQTMASVWGWGPVWRGQPYYPTNEELPSASGG